MAYVFEDFRFLVLWASVALLVCVLALLPPPFRERCFELLAKTRACVVRKFVPRPSLLAMLFSAARANIQEVLQNRAFRKEGGSKASIF